MKNKNMFIIAIAVLLTFTFIVSTSALVMSGISEDPVQVSVILDDSSSVRWTSFISGLEQAAKDTGIKVKVVNTTKNLSLSQQNLLINQELNSGADGIILQLTSSRGTENMISSISRKAVLLLVDTSGDMDVDVEGRSACIQVNNVELGRALANEVSIAYGKDHKGKKVGILAGNLRQNSNSERLEGFTEKLKASGATTAWVDSNVNYVSDKIGQRQQDNPADIIVALDNSGLEAACEYALRQSEPPTIFGEGTSIKVVSYLDDGLITSMVVPNEYYMGYQSITAVSNRLDNRLTPMEDETIAFRVVNRDNLFDENNQRLLFPVVQ